MNLESIMLPDTKGQVLDKYCIISLLFEVQRIGNFIDTESRLEVTTGWGKGRLKVIALMVTEFPFGVTKIWAWILVRVTQGGECNRCH